jgi:UDP-4-amino-4,6-dideoxy-N-acetyl-beta-L-altrosamine transaminase
VIPYGRQSIDESDIEAVARVLRGDWLTTGPAVEAFEQAVVEYTGAKHAVAFNSATSALHGACHAAGLGPGDVVHTSPLTFMASANCARYVGARPALIDIDEATWNIDLAQVDASVDALVAVDYAGLPVDLAAAPHRPRVVIQDSSHALGALTPDGPVGNCAHSDVTVFSFHPVKPITSAEGGMATTNDDELADRMRRFRSHGIDRRPMANGWEYDAVEVGFNYRLTDVQSALGASQMRRLDSFIVRRNEIAARYRELLADLPIALPPAAPEGWRHGHHLFAVRVPERATVFRRLREEGIGVQVHYVPIHHHTVSSDIEIPPGGFPVADAVYDGLLSLPIYAGLTDREQDTVVATLRRVLAEAG